MSVGLSDEQVAFVEAIRDFAAREKFEVPEEDGHSDDVARRMGELGWYGLQIPEEYGGSGGSFLDATLFLEETTRGRIPIGGYGVTLIVVGALNSFGTEEKKQELLGGWRHRAQPCARRRLSCLSRNPQMARDFSGCSSRHGPWHFPC